MASEGERDREEDERQTRNKCKALRGEQRCVREEKRDREKEKKRYILYHLMILADAKLDVTRTYYPSHSLA